MKKLFFIVFLFLSLKNHYANGIFTSPQVKNYTKKEYGASRQNWNITQDSQGILYFANNDGLLQFDGKNWQLYVLPNRLGLRSVAVDQNDRIYVGSYEEFGYFEQLPNGTLLYHSLSNTIDYQFNNDEFWRIVILNNKVYFQSFGSYFVYDGKQVVPHRPDKAILFFLKTGETILAQFINSELSVLSNDSLVRIPSSEIFCNDLVRTAFQIDGNRILIGTSSHGLYIYQTNRKKFVRWKTEADDILTEGQINCGETSDSVYFFGTIGKGAVAIDRKGKLLWHICKENALLTNTVHYIFQDLQNNTWMALDKGIAQVRISSPVRFVISGKNNIEMVHTAALFNNNIYVGTNIGLYKLQQNGNENTFLFIPQTLGQVWDLSITDNQLLCGQNDHTFRIENDRAVPISPLTGGTTIRPVTINDEEFLIQATYTLFAVYKKNSLGYWEFSHEINGFLHPIRFHEIDHLGYIWASHFTKGLYRIKLNKDLTNAVEVKSYGIANGLPGDYKVNVVKIAGRVVFCTGERFYTFDDLSNRIVPYTWFNKKLGKFAKARLVIPVKDKQYWLICNNEFVLIETDKDYVEVLDIVPFSLLNNDLVEDNEFVLSVGVNKFLFCLDNGLAVYDRNVKTRNCNFTPGLLIRQAKATSNKNSILLPLKTDEKHKAIIPFAYRRIMFTFGYPDFNSVETIIRCVVKGSNTVFTDSLSQQSKINIFVESGQYELNASVHDVEGKVLASIKYYFMVKPPFYASATAYGLYFLILILIILLMWRGIKKHVKRQNEKILMEQQKIQQERIEHREQKITLLKNEKLQAELAYKSKELASSTMSIIRKNEVLIMLRKEIEMQKEKLGIQYPNKYYDKIIRLIDRNISSDDDWQIFQRNFDMIHENFFRKIKKEYPELTANDLKLCAYLRLNLSTKEIASLLNISIRGIEAARHRLRKKISLPPERNLTEFFIEFK